MFKAVFSNNKVILSKLIEAIFDYYRLDIDIKGKELIIKNNELPLDNYQDKQLVCDYIIRVDDDTELNIEINRSTYIGLYERNMTYSFKIFYEHFRAGDGYSKFEKFTLIQVNFNNFSNPNNKNINKYYVIDVDDVANKLSNSFSIMNIDIASCYNLVYNSDNLEEISDLEKWSAIISCEYLEDISSILERGKMISMNEKEKFLNDIKEKAQDKDVLNSIKLENTVEERIRWIEEATKNRAWEEGLEEGTKQGIEQGIEQGVVETKKNIILEMIKKNISINDISDIIKMSVEDIKKIIKENE